MILTVRPALLTEAEWIGGRLRPEDELEVSTSTGLPGIKVVPLSFHYSKECYSVRLETEQRVAHQPFAIFGVCDDPANQDVGIVWLLATPAIRLAPISILREAQHWIRHFHTRYPRGLYNIVDVRNDLHVRWLKLSGFKIQGTVVHNGHDFYYCLRRDDNV